MEEIVFKLSVVIVGAAALGVAAHFLKQPLLIAYIAAGVIAGPYVLKLAGDPEHIEFIRVISKIGIVLLLFLAGIVLNPQRMLKVFRDVSVATLAACAVFLGTGFGVAVLTRSLTGLSWAGCVLLGVTSMFSSTVLTIKLLPAGKLHRQPIGTLCVGILIFQDLLAVLVLLGMRGYHEGMLDIPGLARTLGPGIGLIVFAFLFAKYALGPLLAMVERYAELIFVTSLAWCFGMAELCEVFGLSREIGAFIAGISLASNPLAIYISQKVIPLRDFFIVMFFFALGAMLNLGEIVGILPYAVGIAVLYILLKPPVINILLRLRAGQRPLAKEASIRLGQWSEFSLIIAALALELGQINQREWNIITVSCLLTMVISTYIVVLKYPTPLGVTGKLKQN